MIFKKWVSAKKKFAFWRISPSPSPSFFFLPINLVKWSCISEAALPHFIHDLFGLLFALADRSVHNWKDCSSANTFLMLLCKFELSSWPEFTAKATLATKTGRTDLRGEETDKDNCSAKTPQLDENKISEAFICTHLSTSSVSQVLTRPVDFESQVVVQVNHLMGHCVLDMIPDSLLVGADDNAVIGIETTTYLGVLVTSSTEDVFWSNIASKLSNVIL